MREKVLLTGDSNTSKTFSLVSLAMLYPDRKVIIFDPDDGTAKTLGEFGLSNADFPNLTIIPVRNNWEEFMATYTTIRTTLAETDWMCVDMLGRFWDMAQQYYSQRVFGQNPIEHLMTLKRQAQGVQFNGFDGLQDWPLIKRIHNELFVDDMVVYSKFSVMCTTAAKDFMPMEKVPKTGTQSIYAAEFGMKPEGEKHNIFRFDTQAVMYRKPAGTYHFRLVRDRGRHTDIKQEFDITGKSFWQVFCEYREIPL